MKYGMHVWSGLGQGCQNWICSTHSSGIPLTVRNKKDKPYLIVHCYHYLTGNQSTTKRSGS